jgi:hypothetical protein
MLGNEASDEYVSVLSLDVAFAEGDVGVSRIFLVSSRVCGCLLRVVGKVLRV